MPAESHLFEEDIYKDYVNHMSVGHQGNSSASGHKLAHGQANFIQILDDLFSSSNQLYILPLISTLAEIFETARACPFTGLEATGILKFISGEPLGLLKSAGSVKSILASMPILKGKGGGRGR